jgi:hypothetical protein
VGPVQITSNVYAAWETEYRRDNMSSILFDLEVEVRPTGIRASFHSCPTAEPGAPRRPERVLRLLQCEQLASAGQLHGRDHAAAHGWLRRRAGG